MLLRLDFLLQNSETEENYNCETQHHYQQVFRVALAIALWRTSHYPGLLQLHLLPTLQVETCDLVLVSKGSLAQVFVHTIVDLPLLPGFVVGTVGSVHEFILIINNNHEESVLRAVLQAGTVPSQDVPA